MTVVQMRRGNRDRESHFAEKHRPRRDETGDFADSSHRWKFDELVSQIQRMFIGICDCDGIQERFIGGLKQTLLGLY